MIPLDPIGYAVNPSTGTIHTRYADHARDSYRTRTVKGVETLLDGRKPNVCGLCFPTPLYPSDPTPRAPQKRRSGTAKKPKA